MSMEIYVQVFLANRAIKWDAMKVKKKKEKKIKWISCFEEKCYLKILDLSLKICLTDLKV